MAVPRIFQLPRQTPFKLGVVVPGAKATFLKAETTTQQNVYTTAALDVAHSNPVVADSSGEFATIYLDDDLAYRVQVRDASDVLIYDQDKINDPTIRAPYYEQTTAESGAGVTPTDYTREPGDIRRYGATAGGTGDQTASIQQAINQCLQDSGAPVYVPIGVYRCLSALTATSSSAFNFKIYGDYANRVSEVVPGDTSVFGSIIWFDNITSGVCFQIGDGTGEAMSPEMENIFILGDADNGQTPVASNSTTGLRLQKPRSVRTKNVNIRGFFKGFDSTDGWVQTHQDLHIFRCHIGAQWDNSANIINLRHCAFHQTTYGIFFRSGNAFELNNCWFEGGQNAAQNEMVSGLVVGGDTPITSVNVSNCYFEELQDEAVQLGYENTSALGVAASLSTSTSTVRHVMLNGGQWDSVGLDQSGAKVKISTSVNGPVVVQCPLGNFGWSQFTGDSTTINTYVTAAYGSVTGPQGEYETGTWSPVVTDAESSGNDCTMESSTYGRYTRVGNRVFFDGFIRIDGVSGVTTSNTAYVKNLPFAPTTQGSASIGGNVHRAQYINTTAGGDHISISVRNTSTFNFHIPTDSGLDAALTIADIQSVNASHFLTFSGQYVT